MQVRARFRARVGPEAEHEALWKDSGFSHSDLPRVELGDRRGLGCL